MKITIASVGVVDLLEYSAQATVVLVDRYTEYERFVTWTVGEDEDGTVHAYNGHYFSSFSTALVDFHERSRTTDRVRTARESLRRASR